MDFKKYPFIGRFPRYNEYNIVLFLVRFTKSVQAKSSHRPVIFVSLFLNTLGVNENEKPRKIISGLSIAPGKSHMQMIC